MIPQDRHVHSTFTPEPLVNTGAERRTQARLASVPPRLLSVEQAAAYLGVSRRVIWGLLESGELHRVRIPLGHRDVRRTLIDVKDLDRLGPIEVCPHGRPFIVRFPFSEIRRKMGRK